MSTLELSILGVDHGPEQDPLQSVRIRTDAGTIDCRYQNAGETNVGVLWVFGAGGGFGGPAGGLYTRLGGILARERVASLEVNYRAAGHLVSCVLDVLAGIVYLSTTGQNRIILVGHSFGGAVVITAGADDEHVIGVAALSSQSYGADAVSDLSPKPLLLIHGSDDEILPDRCSRDLFRKAGQPKEIKLYPGCRHGLDDCRDEVDRDLLNWIRRVAHPYLRASE